LIYKVTRGGFASAVFHRCCVNQGPTFGAGHDLCVISNSQTNSNSAFNFPHSYRNTTNQGSVTFTGIKNFETNDIDIIYIIIYFVGLNSVTNILEKNSDNANGTFSLIACIFVSKKGFISQYYCTYSFT